MASLLLGVLNALLRPLLWLLSLPLVIVTLGLFTLVINALLLYLVGHVVKSFVVADFWREERKFQIGDTTWPGQTIASIPDLSLMEVLAWLPDVDDGRIAPGMHARCVLDTYPDAPATFAQR